VTAYSLDLSRVDKIGRTYDLAAIFTELSGPFTAASVALLPPRSAPTGSTVWQSVSVSSGMANVLYAGPDVDSTGAVVVTGSCDPWLKVTSGTETDAVKVPGGRITLRGGGNLTGQSFAVLQALIGLDTDGVPFYDPNGVGSPAGLSLDTDAVPYFTV
jgi:hypothetical protein